MKASEESLEVLDSILGALLNLQKRISTACTLEEFHYSVVNELIYLVSYRQAALWRSAARTRSGRIEAISGVPILDREAPYVQWLSSVCQHLELGQTIHPVAITQEDVPSDLQEAWNAWFPRFALWLPVVLPGDETTPTEAPMGGLLLAREEEWTDGEQLMLAQLSITMAPVWWGVLARRTPWRRMWEKSPRLGRVVLLFMLGGVLFLPVRLSVLAPGEVMPHAPVMVRAPIDGVVDEFHVTPNQIVVAGQQLLSLDAKKLDNRLSVIQNELDVARAEHRQAVQTALRNPRDTARITILKGRMEQRAADLVYIQQQLERVKILASRDGVAVFTDANDWIGRPVAIGERIMMLADPKQVELEINLPVADAITLQPGATIELFPTANPDHTFQARLRYVSYRADLTPEGVLAYRLKADFSQQEPPPGLGVRGSAKIHGQEVSLFYYLFRRPLALVRRMVE